MSSAIRVLSERIMAKGFEPTVARLMEGVQDKVVRQPGLLSIKTLNDVNDRNKYLILTKWQSKAHYQKWLDNPEYKLLTEKLNDVTARPVQYRVFEYPKEDIFLL